MEAILKFNLPEDKEQLQVATKAENLFLTLWDLNNYLRDKIKYSDISPAFTEIYEDVRTELFKIMENKDVSFDMLS